MFVILILSTRGASRSSRKSVSPNRICNELILDVTLPAFPGPQFADFFSPGAAYNSSERSPPPRCHPGTRTDILEEIQGWVNRETPSTNILWLHAPAGAGKSAIAQTIAEGAAKRGQLAASFFFAKSSSRRNAKKHLLPTIAVQIAAATQGRRERLSTLLFEDPLLLNCDHGPVELIARLLTDPTFDANFTSSSPFLVVIDGLDECGTRQDQTRILFEILELVSVNCVPLRFLIVSRPEAHITDAFDEESLSDVTERISIYGDHRAHNDIAVYLRAEFQSIRQSRKHRDIMQYIKGEWPSAAVIDELVEKSGGYFVYPSVVIRFVGEDGCDCRERLSRIMGIKSSDYDSDAQPFAELDKLYSEILSSYSPSQRPFIKRILGFICVLPYVDCLTDIADALPNVQEGQVRQILRGLRSLLDIDDDVHVTPFHKSFLDFLFDPDRARGFYIDRDEWCQVTFRYCFTAACESLRLARHPIVGPRY